MTSTPWIESELTRMWYLHWRLWYLWNRWRACGTPDIHVLECRIFDGENWLATHTEDDPNYSDAQRLLSELRWRLAKAFEDPAKAAAWARFRKREDAFLAALAEYQAVLSNARMAELDKAVGAKIESLGEEAANHAAERWAQEHPEVVADIGESVDTATASEANDSLAVVVAGR